jgi:type I restriction enzyme S subunit
MREGWEMQKLDDVCKVIAGQSPKSQFYNEDKIGLPFYQGKKEFQKKYIGEPTKWTSKITKEAFEDDIIMSVRAPVGPVNFATQKCCIGRGLAAIRSSKLIDKDYCFFYLQSKEDELIGNSGAVFNSINKTQIGNIQIPIPPLPEQKQIVALLDKAFAGIDQAQANIEKNIENAKELFQSKLNEIFSQPARPSGGKGEGDAQSLSKGWEEKPLGEICSVLNGFAFKSKDTIPSSNTQLLRMGNLYQNILDLNRKPVFYPDSFTKEYETYLLKEGDLIMSLTGTVDKTDYGYTVKIPHSEISLLLNQRIMKIDVRNDNILNKDYLRHYLLSPDFLKRLYSTASGTRQANLSSRTILTLTIGFPTSLNKQIEIVSLLEYLKQSANDLEIQYYKKLANLEDLKKSILQKAFSGALTVSNHD